MDGFRPFSAGSFSARSLTACAHARSLCSVMMCKLLLLGSTAGFVILAGKQGAIAAGSTTAGNPQVKEQSGKERVLGYTPCPPIRTDCDRNTAIDIGNSLPDDFTVSKQTPYRTGRNEVLITSPSTGTEQRFEINLPDTGSFQLYKASFNKVKVSNPEKVLGPGASLSPQQVAAKLRRFEIQFEQNAPKTVVLADGTRGEFSASGVVIRSKNGRVIETVKTSAMGRQFRLLAALRVSSNAVVAQAGSGGRSCQSSIRSKLYDISQEVQQKGSDIQKQKASSENAKLIAWVTTFSQKALEDSLIASNRNQTLQQVACAKPVQCNQPQNYSGGWETRTDLFKLPGGNNSISLRYEFYQIPDRIELWRDGELIFSRGPKSGSETLEINDKRLYGSGFVGVKLIGNPTNKKTRWNYTISCFGQFIAKPIDSCDPTVQSNSISSVLVSTTIKKANTSFNPLPENFKDDSLHLLTDSWLIKQNQYPPKPVRKPVIRKKKLPKFSDLVRNYPNEDSATVRKEIGGKVNAEANREAFKNSCAIRMSKAFNFTPDSNHTIPPLPKKTSSGKQKMWYIFRVKDFIDHMKDRYGEPDIRVVRDSNGKLDKNVFLGKKGVFAIEVSAWSDATGHMTLWDGKECIGMRREAQYGGPKDDCYFNKADAISLWIAE